jgi:hypothetical protein
MICRIRIREIVLLLFCLGLTTLLCLPPTSPEINSTREEINLSGNRKLTVDTIKAIAPEVSYELQSYKDSEAWRKIADFPARVTTQKSICLYEERSRDDRNRFVSHEYTAWIDNEIFISRFQVSSGNGSFGGTTQDMIDRKEPFWSLKVSNQSDKQLHCFRLVESTSHKK